MPNSKFGVRLNRYQVNKGPLLALTMSLIRQGKDTEANHPPALTIPVYLCSKGGSNHLCAIAH